jgi:hypothetical protein
MSETPDFRNWAARVVDQASKERNASQAHRLRSIAGTGNGSPISKTGKAKAHKPPRPKRTSGLPRFRKSRSSSCVRLRSRVYACEC